MPRPRIPDRRERLLDAAETLVLDRGFDAMSVAAVAERAGVGKGAVYLEFTGKDEIRDALLARATARWRDRVRDDVGEVPGLGAAYRASIRTLLDDPLLTAAFLDDRGVLGAHVAEVDDGRYAARHRAVVDWVTELQRRGSVVADVDAEALALALSSTTIGLLSAGRMLGPLTPELLERTIDTVGRMASGFERT